MEKLDKAADPDWRPLAEREATVAGLRAELERQMAAWANVPGGADEDADPTNESPEDAVAHAAGLCIRSGRAALAASAPRAALDAVIAAERRRVLLAAAERIAYEDLAEYPCGYAGPGECPHDAEQELRLEAAAWLRARAARELGVEPKERT